MPTIRRRKAPVLFALFFTALTHAMPPESALAVGDFVFRAGTGRESAIIRHASDSEWSHIGIVVAIEPHVRILHATTDDAPARANQIITSSYAEYSAPRLAERIAVARPQFLSTAQRQTLARTLQQQEGQPFNLAARHNAPRYCTTIIHDALHTLRPDLPLRWQHSSLPVIAGEYLFPQAFADLPELYWLPEAEEQ